MSEPEKAVSGTATVVVGCKLPHGWILEIGKKGEDSYASVELKGMNKATIAGGYGLTEVSKEFWDTWYKKGQRLVPVKQGLVFMQKDHDNAMAVAMDRHSVKSGFERLTPADLPKDKKGRPLVTEYTTDDK